MQLLLIMASNISRISKDLVSASSEKLEPLPGVNSSTAEQDKEAEKAWLEEMTEKAERSEWAMLLALWSDL